MSSMQEFDNQDTDNHVMDNLKMDKNKMEIYPTNYSNKIYPRIMYMYVENRYELNGCVSYKMR